MPPPPSFFPFADAFAYPDGPLPGQGPWVNLTAYANATVASNTVVGNATATRGATLPASGWDASTRSFTMTFNLTLPAGPSTAAKFRWEFTESGYEFLTIDVVAGPLLRIAGTGTFQTIPFVAGTTYAVLVSFDAGTGDYFVSLDGSGILSEVASFPATPTTPGVDPLFNRGANGSFAMANLVITSP